MNPFNQLDAQDETSRLSQMTPEEQGEYQDWLDSRPEDNQSDDGEPMGSNGLSDDADALASAGHGMDEDYYVDSVDSFYEE